MISVVLHWHTRCNATLAPSICVEWVTGVVMGGVSAQGEHLWPTTTAQKHLPT